MLADHPETTAAPAPSADGAARRRREMLGAYLGAALLSLAAAMGMLDLWRANLRFPFDYRGDAAVHALTFKSTIENGWFLTVPQVGAPGQLDMHDFLVPDTLHLLVVKVMSLFTSSWMIIFNLYFLLGFPLITVAALAVFREFRVPLGPAVTGAVLYAFLPSRLLKGETHLFLDLFYQVPLAILAALWVCGDDPPVTRDRGPGRWPGLELGRSRSILAVIFCVVTALAGIYYAFFAAFLLVVGGLWASADRRAARHALSGLALAAVILLTSAVNAVPSLLYTMRHGKNLEVAARVPAEAEIYGLKIIQLLMPVTGHRLAALRGFTDRYDATSPLITENRVIMLGVLGSIGFLVLLAHAVLRPRADNPRGDLLRTLGVLNLAAVLLGTIGGFGSVIARVLTPEIRTYARINVVIGFLALFCFVLLLERAGRRRRWLAFVLPPLMLVLGLFDQVTPAATRPYAAVRAQFRADASFVHEIEAALPEGAMVFELPFLPFPEVQAPGRMSDYDPLIFYLHSRSLRWSYPTMRGRPSELWTRNVAGHAPDRMAAELAAVGFGGVLVDRFGYADNGQALETALGQILDVRPRVSRDGRMSFFNLEPFKARARAGTTREEQERRRELALHPLLFHWASGCYDPENGPQGPFRWCNSTATLDVENTGATVKAASISMTLAPARMPCRITIDGDLLPAPVELTQATALFQRTLEISPGNHTIRFRADGWPADAPLDPRTLIFHIDNAKLSEVDRP